MPSKPLNALDLAQYIDHTLLRPEATIEQLSKLCEEAAEFNFRTVCIESRWLNSAVRLLAHSKVLPITVISFPTGDLETSKKVEEAKKALGEGAREIDMVMNRTLLFEKNMAAFFMDIRAVVETAASVPVKVILETSELENSQKQIACAFASAAGARFVKTSTGFSKSGATERDVQLMRQTVGPNVGVKASGGIRSFDDALKMIRAGANRLGTSASVEIIKGLSAKAGSY